MATVQIVTSTAQAQLDLNDGLDDFVLLSELADAPGLHGKRAADILAPLLGCKPQDVWIGGSLVVGRRLKRLAESGLAERTVDRAWRLTHWGREVVGAAEIYAERKTDLSDEVLFARAEAFIQRVRALHPVGPST